MPMQTPMQLRLIQTHQRHRRPTDNDLPVHNLRPLRTSLPIEIQLITILLFITTWTRQDAVVAHAAASLAWTDG